jgi:tellurite resistance protein
MGDSGADLGLGGATPESLRAAVEAVLAQQSGASKLRAGAVATADDAIDDAVAAAYFQSLLELGYLVASADGLADDERGALAHLVEHATDAAVHREALLLHFADLEAGSETLGRRERLVRTAAEFEDADAHTEALSFATLIAVADGQLADSEAAVLRELGSHFSLSADQVQVIVDGVVAAIKGQLEGGS